MPSSWDVMAEDEEVKLSLLDLESPIEGEEYERVAGAFLQSLPNADIMRIDRVQNKLLWKKYCDRSETMMKFNNGILREQMLFHGTSHNDPALIYGEDVGFDRRFSGDGMWGQGNYFAVNAAYSNGYAYHSHGVRKMFAAWVLTGIPYDSPSNRSLRMPPYRDTFGRPENVIKRRYDCITGMTGGTRVYITYENDLAYPAYLITYRH